MKDATLTSRAVTLVHTKGFFYGFTGCTGPKDRAQAFSPSRSVQSPPPPPPPPRLCFVPPQPPPPSPQPLLSGIFLWPLPPCLLPASPFPTRCPAPLYHPEVTGGAAKALLTNTADAHTMPPPQQYKGGRMT